MSRRFLVGLCLALLLALSETAHAGGAPALGLNWGKTVEPGEYVAMDGWSWFPEIMGCELPVKLKIKDSGGTTHSMGSIAHRNDDFVTEVSGFRTIPINTRAGNATIVGTQDIRLKVFGFGCLKVGSKDARLRNVKVLGELGNDPPRLTDVVAENASHGGGAAIRWNQSEAAGVTVELSYLFTPKHAISVGTLLQGDRTAGANALPFDGTFQGQPLPLGRYRVRIQAKDASGATSAYSRAEFMLGTG
jgi:hypothetical protein